MAYVLSLAGISHKLCTHMAEWTLQPSVSGSLVLSVQCESRVKYLGITTCCPTLWLRDNATLKLYRFRWRIRTLRDRRKGQMLRLGQSQWTHAQNPSNSISKPCSSGSKPEYSFRVVGKVYLQSHRQLPSCPPQLGARYTVQTVDSRSFMLWSASPCSAVKQKQAALTNPIILYKSVRGRTTSKYHQRTDS